MAFFDILMQNFYKLQQSKSERVTLYVTQLEGALNAVQQEYLMMLSTYEVQQLLRDWFFSWAAEAVVGFNVPSV